MRTLLAAMLALAAVSMACRDQPQLSAVDDLTDGSYLVRIACLDVNDDNRVDSEDADPARITDLNGDARVDAADAAILGSMDIPLLEGRPSGCDGSPPPEPDWLVTDPPIIDCVARQRSVLLYGVGGGAVDFTDHENAAGVRWMMHELSNELETAGVPAYSASVAPGVHGAANEHLASEHWSEAFLAEVLTAHPCLHIVLLGHSYGALHVKAVAAEIESAGFADRVVLTVLVDRWAALYGGTTGTFPSQSPILNFSQSGDGPIDRPNVENVDATDFMAPEDGEEGGDLVQVTHNTIDNSPDVLERVITRVFEELEIARH